MVQVEPGAVTVSVTGQTVVYVISTSVVVPTTLVGPGTVTVGGPPPHPPTQDVTVMVEVVNCVTS